MSGSTYDVVIVGAGIVGLSSAYHIKKDNPDFRVLVLDRAPTYAQGNTAKSAASFRDLFSEEINFKLSHSTIEFYKHIQASGYNIGVNRVGYLFLFRKDDPRKEILLNLQKKTSVRFFDRDEVAGFPGLETKPEASTADLMGLFEIEDGAVGENCGTVEAELVSKYYYEQCISLGVEFKFNTELKEFRLDPVNKLDFPGEPFLWQDKKIADLDTNRGTIKGSTYVCATDIWATRLLEGTGIDSHIRPKKRQLFQLTGPSVDKILYGWKYNEMGIEPFTILPYKAVYIRPAPKFKSVWAGVADDYNRDFTMSEDPQPEKEFFERSLMPVLTAYYPGLSEAKLTGSWAGYYSYNTIDKSPYIFRDLNLVVATGTSGSGILKGDGIGRNVSALVSEKENVRLFDGSIYNVEETGLYKRKTMNEQMIL